MDDVPGVLKAMADKGIVALDAWYLPGDTLCVAPDGSKAMNVIVPPRFVVRLERAQPEMDAMGFEREEEPQKILCGYGVEHYRLQPPD